MADTDTVCESPTLLPDKSAHPRAFTKNGCSGILNMTVQGAEIAHMLSTQSAVFSQGQVRWHSVSFPGAEQRELRRQQRQELSSPCLQTTTTSL